MKFTEKLRVKLREFTQRDYSKSYSQSGEDMIVHHIFHSLGIQKPTYLDIGTHHPVRGNNTYSLYVNGSRGVCVEPNKNLYKIIKNKRPKDVCLNVGVSSSEGVLDYFTMDTSTLNTFSKSEVKDYESMGHKVLGIEKIPVVTIESILSKYGLPQFVSIDTEGLNFDILKTFPNEYLPLVICSETMSYSNTGNGVKDVELIEYLKTKGYLVYADTNINTIFVKENIWKR